MATPITYATTPNSVQTKNYPLPTANVVHPRWSSPRKAVARRYRSSMGMVEGNIIATIIASHIKVKIAAVASSLPIGIHIMLIVQLPGMGIPPDIECLK